jgi:hypothetical protein
VPRPLRVHLHAASSIYPYRLPQRSSTLSPSQCERARVLTLRSRGQWESITASPNHTERGGLALDPNQPARRGSPRQGDRGVALGQLSSEAQNMRKPMQCRSEAWS